MSRTEAKLIREEQILVKVSNESALCSLGQQDPRLIARLTSGPADLGPAGTAEGRPRNDLFHGAEESPGSLPRGPGSRRGENPADHRHRRGPGPARPGEGLGRAAQVSYFFFSSLSRSSATSRMKSTLPSPADFLRNFSYQTAASARRLTLSKALA